MTSKSVAKVIDIRPWRATTRTTRLLRLLAATAMVSFISLYSLSLGTNLRPNSGRPSSKLIYAVLNGPILPLLSFMMV